MVAQCDLLFAICDLAVLRLLLLNILLHHHAKLLLEALREVARSRESHSVREFVDTYVGLLTQKAACLLQSYRADDRCDVLSGSGTQLVVATTS